MLLFTKGRSSLKLRVAIAAEVLTCWVVLLRMERASELYHQESILAWLSSKGFKNPTEVRVTAEPFLSDRRTCRGVLLEKVGWGRGSKTRGWWEVPRM